MTNEKKLKERVSELEQELSDMKAEAAHLRLSLKTANTRLEKLINDFGHEIKLANRIQKLLAPSQLPNIPGFEFSSKFIPGGLSGGDYFDIFEHEDRLRFGILLASSSGYSTSALFLSVLIKLASKIEARRGLSPDQVLQQMSKEIVPDMTEKDLAQIFYGFVDRRSFELNYILAGDIVGFFCPEGQKSVVRLAPSTTALRKGHDGHSAVLLQALGPRDKIILCTDGVIRAKNAEGEEFGIERLSHAIIKVSQSHVHDLRNEILYRVEKFTGKSSPDRDQTVIVIEVKDKVIKLAKS